MLMKKALDLDAIKYPQGIKWTRQRREVYRILLAASQPLSAAQIYSAVSASGETGEEPCAVSTVYRILAAFEERSIVVKTGWMDGGTAGYALERGGHTHYAVCLNCHRRIPLQDCPFARISHGAVSHAREAELLGEGFQVVGHKLELYGYCERCRGTEEVFPDVSKFP